MPDLSFNIEGVEAPQHAAAPQLIFKLRVTNDSEEESIHSVALRCQIQIEAIRRSYNGMEKEQLFELFGEPERWSQTLRSMLWTHANVVVPPFVGSSVVDFPVACTYDFNIASAKYFYALENGEVPLCFLFSGTVFYKNYDSALQIDQISWEKEAKYRLPVRVWKEMMNIYYPNSAWLYLHKDVFDRLYSYKVKNGLTTWEQALEKLLPETDKEMEV